MAWMRMLSLPQYLSRGKILHTMGVLALGGASQAAVQLCWQVLGWPDSVPQELGRCLGRSRRELSPASAERSRLE